MADGVLVEEVDRRKADYKIIHPGQSHPNSRDFPGYIFLTERPSRAEAWVQRFYCNPRVAQNVYNASVGYEYEAITVPIIPRTYLERRDTYAPLTKRTALTGVIRIFLTNGGSGYLDAPTVSFSGGAGSGAAAIALVYRGAVVGVVITAEGTGYTSAPSVVFTPTNGGAAAAATSVIQPVLAVLVAEKADRMEGDIFDSIYVRVTRIYQVVPGEEVVGKSYDELGVKQTVTKQTVFQGTEPDPLSLMDTASEVVAKDTVLAERHRKTMATVSTRMSLRLRPGGGTIKRVETFPVSPGTIPASADVVIKDVVEQLAVHQSRRITESLADSVGAAVSADGGYTISKFDPLRQVWIYTTFKWVASGTIGPTRGSAYLSGYANDSWTKEVDNTDKIILAVEWTTIPLPRSELKPFGKQLPAIMTWTSLVIDSQDEFPPPFYGDGRLPNFVSILRHRALTLPAKVIYTYHYGQQAQVPLVDRVISFTSRFLPIRDNMIHPAVQITRLDTGVVVEDIPASIPPTYDPNDVFVGMVAQRHWMSNIWEREVWLYSENLDPTLFATFYAGMIFVATQQNDILTQPYKGGETLYLKSASGAESTVVTIYGRLKGELVEKKLTLSGTTELSTSPKEFDRVRHLRAHDDPEGVITLRGTGGAAVGYVEYTGVPADGDTLVVGKTGTQRTYTYRAPGVGSFLCITKANFADNSVGAMDYCNVTLSGIVNRFAFDRAGTGANPPANPGTLTIVNISAATTAAEVAVLLEAAILTIATLFADASGDTVTVTALWLGALTATESVTNAGFTATTVVAGTAVAANQIRSVYGLTGAGATAALVAGWTADAINLAGQAGVEYSSATTIHADVEADVDADNTGLVILTDKTHAAEGQAWTLSETGTASTTTAFVASADGPVIATLNPALPVPYNRHAYRDVVLSVPELINGSPELGEANVPASVNLTSDPMVSPVVAGVKLRLAARGSPVLPASYQVLRSATVTISIATPAVVTWASHPFQNGTNITFTTTGALPTGITAGTNYYIVNKAANTFELSLTEGGASIATSGTQSGVHTGAGWAPGAVTLPSLGGSNVYTIALTETDLTSIRVKINNSNGEEQRAVHVELLWPQV